jgi:hypothetical protein
MTGSTGPLREAEAKGLRNAPMRQVYTWSMTNAHCSRRSAQSLRLMDTIIGIAVGIACKWIASLLFYRAEGEEVR